MTQSSSRSVTKYECPNADLKVIATKTSCTIREVEALIPQLDDSRGVMLTSRYEYPGRYTRWDIGFINPPIVIESIGNEIIVTALNENGRILIPVFKELLSGLEITQIDAFNDSQIKCTIKPIQQAFTEEDRSKLPHVINVVRYFRDAFFVEDDKAGFYGAFGYDLGLDFMGVTQTQHRDQKRDLILYLPDELFVTDHAAEISYRIEYVFETIDGNQTSPGARSGEKQGYEPVDAKPSRDMEKGEYASIVETAKEYFARGDLFEVVPSQVFHEPCKATPSQVFNQLLDVNPAPYGALINLGGGEWTVSASPEMYVRVDGTRVESCPIAGTIARGSGDITDAHQIETLLSSEKEKSELTMCTDVDRNDKSRVCFPETIKVIGRRQIELYSRLIHTVDHVEAYLLDGCDSIDAFLTHMWAVTVTGAPKLWAMNFIEKFEKSPRRFYGGSMGFVGFNGSMNTGLMLRTIHFCDGLAHIRVGATLLADSDPESEEKETELKASAMLDVVRFCHGKAIGDQMDESKIHKAVPSDIVVSERPDDMIDVPDSEIRVEHVLGSVARLDQPRVLLVDCEDSFVHTLAGYLRIAGAQVETHRVGFNMEEFESLLSKVKPNLICLSPGPGSPSDFGLVEIIKKSIAMNIPIFGVCLGLQAIVEYFNGELNQLDIPMHGKPSTIVLEDDSGVVFKSIDSPFEAGRYHSLYANEEKLPNELRVTARTQEDSVIMAIEHTSLPIAAVQFHPESIMTMENNVGHKMIQNVIDDLAM